MAVKLVADDVELVFAARVPERGSDGGRAAPRAAEGALELDRVLRGEDDERLAQLPRDAVDRDLALRHRLEQRRLRLRHRAVDLVDEDDVREDRAGPELEVPGLLVQIERPVTSVG